MVRELRLKKMEEDKINLNEKVSKMQLLKDAMKNNFLKRMMEKTNVEMTTDIKHELWKNYQDDSNEVSKNGEE